MERERLKAEGSTANLSTSWQLFTIFHIVIIADYPSDLVLQSLCACSCFGSMQMSLETAHSVPSPALV